MILALNTVHGFVRDFRIFCFSVYRCHWQATFYFFLCLETVSSNLSSASIRICEPFCRLDCRGAWTSASSLRADNPLPPPLASVRQDRVRNPVLASSVPWTDVTSNSAPFPDCLPSTVTAAYLDHTRSLLHYCIECNAHCTFRRCTCSPTSVAWRYYWLDSLSRPIGYYTNLKSLTQLVEIASRDL